MGRSVVDVGHADASRGNRAVLQSLGTRRSSAMTSILASCLLRDSLRRGETMPPLRLPEGVAMDGDAPYRSADALSATVKALYLSIPAPPAVAMSLSFLYDPNMFRCR